jgi:CIC family chloride channel protein
VNDYWAIAHASKDCHIHAGKQNWKQRRLDLYTVVTAQLRDKYPALAHRIRRLLERWQPPERGVLIVMALIVGLGGGLGAVIFRWLINSFTHIFFDVMRDWLSFMGPAYVVVVPAIGGLFVGPMIYFFAREAKGHGVPEVMEAIALRGGRIRPVVVVVKALASSLCIGSGGSAGREGPIVQIGSALGSTLGQVLNLSSERIRNLVACGAAAGIAATFNAPIAGVIFALEIVLGEFNVGYFSTVVISSVMASIVGRIAFGNVPSFAVPQYSLVSPWELLLYALLGVLAGLAARIFVWALYRCEDLFDAWRFPEYLKPVVGGVLIGVVGFYFPTVFGVGYPTIEDALLSKMLVGMMGLLVLIKILATSLTIGSGGSGGVFSPSLFIGAMLGGTFGSVAHQVLPDITAGPGAYALVGMAAVFAGAAHAPLTAIIILFEMTQDYRIILPLMFATVISTILAQRLEAESIYTLKLRRRGIDVRAKKDVNLMRAILVEEAMTPAEEFTTVKPTTSLPELARLFQETAHHGFIVLDKNDELCGVVTLLDLERAIETGKADATVGDICTRNVVTTFPDETLDDALRHFGALDVGRIPVVDRRNPRHLVGVLRRGDIVHSYSHALVDKHEREHHLARVRLERAIGAELVEIDLNTGDAAIGKRLKELKLPSDCVIVSIQRGGRVVVPRGNTQLLAGDRVIAFAANDSADNLRRVLHRGKEGTTEESNPTRQNNP